MACNKISSLHVVHAVHGVEQRSIARATSDLGSAQTDLFILLKLSAHEIGKSAETAQAASRLGAVRVQLVTASTSNSLYNDDRFSRSAQEANHSMPLVPAAFAKSCPKLCDFISELPNLGIQNL